MQDKKCTCVAKYIVPTTVLMGHSRKKITENKGTNPVKSSEEVPLLPSVLALGGGVATFRARP